jgi:hypothetical protein
VASGSFQGWGRKLLGLILRDYRVEAFEDLFLDRSTLGDAFGASGSCQCLLTILIVVSSRLGELFEDEFFGSILGTSVSGATAAGVSIVLSFAGST